MAKKNQTKKNKKWSKILDKILDPFGGFFWIWVFLPYRFFISKKHVFSAGGVAAGAFFKKEFQNSGENVGPFLDKILDPFFWLLFGKNIQNALKPI